MALTYAPKKPAQPQRPQETVSIDDPSIIDKLKHVGVGGLTRVGSFLDLIPSMARDVVSGENPFDQLLSPFSSENRASGEDVLKTYGYRNPGWVASLATETALNPLALFGVGLGTSALSRGGKIAKASGLLSDAADGARRGLKSKMNTTLRDLAPDGESLAKARRAATAVGENFDDIADMPIQGLFSTRLPFGQTRVHGTGKTAQKIAKGIDVAGSAFDQLPPVRHFKAMFDARNRSATTRPTQLAMRKLSGKLDERNASRREFIQDLANKIKAKGFDNDESMDMLREAFESGEVSDELADVIGPARQKLNEILAASNARGRSVAEFADDEIERYAPRYASEVVGEGGGRRVRPLNPNDPSSMGRQEILRNIGGGTPAIRKMLTDPDVEKIIEDGVSRKLPKETIRKQVQFQLQDRYADSFQFADDADNMIGNFADWAVSMPASQRKAGFFGNHPLADLDMRIGNADLAELSDEALFDVLSDLPELAKTVRAKSTDDYLQRAFALDEDFVPVTKVLEDAGLDPAKGLEIVAARAGLSVEDMQRIGVPKSVAADLDKLREPVKRLTPGPVLGAYDSMLNAFKSSVTSPFPSFHTRNFASGQVQNMATGQFGGRDVATVNRILRGGTDDSLMKLPQIVERLQETGREVNAANAADAFRELAAARGLTQATNNAAADAVGLGDVRPGQIGDYFDDLAGGQGGSRPFSYTDVARQAAGRTDDTTLNPMKAKVRGVSGAQQSTLGPFAAGETAGNYVENMNRLPPFLTNLRRGFDVDEAARGAVDAQLDYSSKAFTPFESDYMKRIFPFYSFSRGIAPKVARNLAEQPGGKLAEGVRTASRLREQGDTQGVVPEYIAETAAIPLPSGKSGDPRYLTGFGLMPEDPLSFVAPPRELGLELLSRTSPIIKGPLEYFFGESTFQRGPGGGRDLESMDPSIGRTISNVMGYEDPVKLPLEVEHLVANSPLARFIGTARTATDPRKGLGVKAVNLLTGGRITDVPQAAQDYALRQKAVDVLREVGARQFETTYVPNEILESLSPEERAFADKILELRKLLDARRRDRQAAEQN